MIPLRRSGNHHCVSLRADLLLPRCVPVIHSTSEPRLRRLYRSPTVARLAPPARDPTSEAQLFPINRRRYSLSSLLHRGVHHAAVTPRRSAVLIANTTTMETFSRLRECTVASGSLHEERPFPTPTGRHIVTSAAKDPSSCSHFGTAPARVSIKSCQWPIVGVITHARSSNGAGWVLSRVSEFVCLSVCSWSEKENGLSCQMNSYTHSCTEWAKRK